MAKKRQKATCHPERNHYGQGLCQTCWEQGKKLNDPEWKQRRLETTRRWLRAKVKTPAQMAKQRMLHLKKEFGITVEEYDAMFKKQDGVCAICKQTNRPAFRRLAVDHNHKTGQVRGLLCTLCNQQLGFVEKFASATHGMWLFTAREYLWRSVVV